MDPFPMFPLGVVLFPGEVLPLQVFEPRYRSLLADLPQHDNRFGVVLIQRGHEVGGADERYDVGTVAEVVRLEELDDEVFLVGVIGRERIRVTRWLEDDPYPQALVERIPSPGYSPELVAAVAAAENAMNQLFGIAVEMGASARDLDIKLPDDPEQAAWMLCGFSPLGPYDRQRLLEIDGPVERLRTLEAALNARTSELRQALGRT